MKIKIMSAKCGKTNIGISTEKYSVPGALTTYHISFHLGTIKAEKAVNTR